MLNDALTYMRQQGLDQTAISYYGVHSYEWGTPTKMLSLLSQQTLTQCGTGRACAATEWGYHTDSAGACASPTQAQEAAYWLQDTPKFAVAEELWFDWSSTEYGIWQCGAVTGTGEVLGW
jgi:hypothetical protein